MEWDAYLDRIDTGVGGRYHTGSLTTDLAVFDAVVADLCEPFSDAGIDAVAGIDALGFVFGTAVARELDVAFYPIRKGGKLPIAEKNRLSTSFTDYTETEKTLELDQSSVTADARMLVVDDWTETGAQLTAATSLIEAAGATVAGIAVLGADDNPVIAELRDRYAFHAVSDA